jgi:hypothetical protein
MRSRVEIAWAVRRAGVSGRGADHRCNRLLLAERDTSAVWRLSSASGGCWYLKRHSSGRFHAREVAALRNWAPALGPGRVPELAAADPEILVMVVTAVPGEPVLGLRLSTREEQQVHRQAGQMLGRLHESRLVPGAGEDASRLTSRVDAHLDQAGGLLTPAQHCILVPEHEQLGGLRPVAADHQDNQAEQPAHQQADDFEQHLLSQPSPHQRHWRNGRSTA